MKREASKAVVDDNRGQVLEMWRRCYELVTEGDVSKKDALLAFSRSIAGMVWDAMYDDLRGEFISNDIEVILRRTSECDHFPYRANTVPLIRIRVEPPCGIMQGKTTVQKRDLLFGRKDGDIFLMAWPGEWSQDVFLVDKDLDDLINIFNG